MLRQEGLGIGHGKPLGGKIGAADADSIALTDTLASGPKQCDAGDLQRRSLLRITGRLLEETAVGNPLLTARDDFLRTGPKVRKRAGHFNLGVFALLIGNPVKQVLCNRRNNLRSDFLPASLSRFDLDALN